MAEITVADNDGEAVGFIALLDGFIGGLFVSPQFHRLGIGKQLVKDAASRKGELEVEVYRENPRALAFYGSLGFREVGEKPLDDMGRPHALVRLKRRAEQL
ncbi:MAG: GNAT family N-acetyltransferase [Rhizobiaceae bacterium]|nr:GNAT family N-acetyltransferase [Rhizobiaceae bacterium]